jgi:hypothetical protein
MWEYAALVRLEFNLDANEYNSFGIGGRWILTASTSSPNFEMKNHPKFEELHTKWSQMVNRKVYPHDEAKKNAKTELIRLLDNDELPYAIITGLAGEDDLDIILKSASQNWETTGRTPSSNLIMMRRRIE